MMQRFKIYFHLKIDSSSLDVEEKVETLVYDIGSFLAAAGGNLSLMLGFSCLSVLLNIIILLESKIRFLIP